MLVLSRKKNESIVINGDIRIEILQIKGKQILLGITAPSSMKVLRGELPACSTSEPERLKEEIAFEATIPFEIQGDDEFEELAKRNEFQTAESRRLPQVVTERATQGSLHDVVAAVMASN